jgi:hypothetical protein
MTDTKKTGMTLGALVAAVILVGGACPSVEPALTWAFKTLGGIFSRDQVQAVLASCAIGVMLTASLPHWTPARWSPGRTHALAGIVGFVVTFAAAFVLVPTRYGAVYAFLSALATPTAAQVIGGITYWLRPCAKPSSLKP